MLQTLIKLMFPSITWRIKTAEKVLYLTFDDGPHDDITPQTLDLLKKYNAKASFFFLGENVEKNKHLVQRAFKEGHVVGNHGFQHLNGWSTGLSKYYYEFKLGNKLIKNLTGKNTILYRPPYGKVTPLQAKRIRKDSPIINWDVLANDFKTSWSYDRCVSKIIENAKPGSIIVLHENNKTLSKVDKILEEILKHYTELGYRFDKLPEV